MDRFNQANTPTEVYQAGLDLVLERLKPERAEDARDEAITRGADHERRALGVVLGHGQNSPVTSRNSRSA